MNSKISKNSSRGFNLLELMVTLSILAIIANIALPSMSDMISNSRMSGYANDIHNAISIARSEAIKRGLAVTVCTSNPAQDECSNSLQWEQGWIVREVKAVSGRDPIILVHEALKNDFTFHGDPTTNSSNIVFNASGMTSGTGSMVLCESGVVDKNTKSVVLNKFGKVSVKGIDRYTPPECY